MLCLTLNGQIKIDYPKKTNELLILICLIKYKGKKNWKDEQKKSVLISRYALPIFDPLSINFTTS